MIQKIGVFFAALFCSALCAAADAPLSGKGVRKVSYLKAIEVDASTGERTLIPGQVEVGLVFTQRPDGLCDVERSELVNLDFVETPTGKVQLPVVVKSSAVAPCN